MGRRLYVGNLPYSATEDQLSSLFSQAGKVDSVRVMRDMATGRARGFAFVEMGSDDDAQKAISVPSMQHGWPSARGQRGAAETEGGFGGGGGNQPPRGEAAVTTAKISLAADAKSRAGNYSSTIQPSRS